MVAAEGVSAVDTDISEDTVDVDSTRIHYLTGGTGDPPLVLLHGGIIDAAHVSWGELLGPLAEETHIYALDLPGYGESELPDEPLSLSTHVDAVAGFVDELDLEAPVVAGISMGGGTAIGLGLEYPDRVSQVVAIDAYGLGSDLSSGLLTWVLAKIQVTNHVSVALMRRSRRVVRGSLENLAADPDAITDEMVDRVQGEAKRPGAGAAFRKFRAAEVTRDGYRTDYSDRVDDLEVPVRYVHGTEDDLFPTAWSERAAERTPDGEFYALEGCGHLGTFEKPDKIRDLIVDVL